MMDERVSVFQQITDQHEMSPDLRRELIECWITVSNAGGAAGFPFPPVSFDQVALVTDQLIAGLDSQRSRLLLAFVDETLAGWLNVRRDVNPLITHWGTVHHVQTHTGFRGRGIGAALMHRLGDVAREEMGLEQLHLAARGGMGLEDFYGRLGWKEIGRWPGALRLMPGDDRDEILMMLTL
ncbi:Acetyltransferase (GNAT) domain-containing protein [Streptosporangium subroseum]|uniref:Acetyltransferase (GNAT) domain-containing protein n=1 Tax=Streptosporangium subroseum TaxID=106412 RepID=A0A239NQV3_9ACTN|nr:GNAT family N-acetyltransferase [Streptosporangium subroseum]SNT57257.1 Acetyltransferase (GNAT) domain-containing protein [Streptosporangium subroseum]